MFANFMRNAVVMTLLMLSCVLNAQVLTNGLLFYASFSGGSVNDVVGGRSGQQLYGTAAVPTSGGVGGGGYLQLQNSTTTPKQAVWYSDPTPATGDFSFQIWARAADVDTAKNGQPINGLPLAANKEWNSGANVGWIIARNSAAGNPNGLWWNLNGTGGTRVDWRPDYYTNVTMFDGAWHQWVVTCQRSGNAVFYRDGILVGQTSISANADRSIRPALSTWITTNILALGEDGTLKLDHNNDGATGGGAALNGDLDEAAMWARVLTAEEVAAAYAKGVQGMSLTASLSPAFAQQPAGGRRYVGESFRLSCLLAGDRGLVSYQWYKGGTAIPDATNRTYLLSALTTDSAGNYTVVASDGVGSITSAPAALTVLAENRVSDGLVAYMDFNGNINPQAGTTIAGTVYGFNGVEQYDAGKIGDAAYFNNDGSAAVGWVIDWSVNLGDIEWIYTNNFSYSLWLKLTNRVNGGLFGNKDWTSGGNVGWVFAPSTSGSPQAQVNYYAPPGPRQDLRVGDMHDSQWHHFACVFDRDSNKTRVYLDGNQMATASIGLTGQELLTPFNWSPNATFIGSSGNNAYSAAGSIDDLGVWTRSLTADDVLAIYAQGLNGQPLSTAIAGTAVRPLISTQPASLTLFEGRKAVLSASATGTPPLSYQWYRNGSLVPGATNSSLTFYPVASTNAGNYTVVVGNTFGSVTSAPAATLTVTPITSISSGLAVYLNFDGNLDAQGGTSVSGTPIGTIGTPTYESGIIGSAAKFNNGDVSQNTPTPADWAVSLGDIEWLYTNSWSVSIWVKTTDPLGSVIGNKDWKSGANIGWIISDYGKARWVNYTANGGARADIGNYNWGEGNWHHVAAVFDRDANTVLAYIDGSLNGQGTLGVTGYESLTPSAILQTLVGGSGAGNSISYTGDLDDLGMWARPLSMAEISSVYSQGLKGQTLSSASTNGVIPWLAAPPASATRPEGLNASFSVKAVGTAPLSYQWFENGVPLQGETNSSLLMPVALSDSGAAITVVVANSYGSVTSTPPAILTVSTSPASVTNNMVVYLNFDGNLDAQGGTSVSGTPIGTIGTPTYESGIVGSAAKFNNGDVSQNTPTPADWAVSLGDIEWLYTNSWSASIWVKTTNTLGSVMGNKDWKSGTNTGWIISGYNKPRWLNYTPVGVTTRSDIGTIDLGDGNWHHAVAVFDRYINRVYFYVDGVVSAAAPLGFVGDESLTPDGIMQTLVGGSGLGNSISFTGDVDDLAMWARPLSQAEVVGLYQAGQQGSGALNAPFGRPWLTVSAAGSEATFVYPGWAKGYALEASSTLSPGSWSPVAATPSLLNGNAAVTVPVEAGAKFFRLRH